MGYRDLSFRTILLSSTSSRHRQQRFWLNLGSEKKKKIGRKRKKGRYLYTGRYDRYSRMRGILHHSTFSFSFSYMNRFTTIHRNIPRFVDGRLSVIHNKEPLLLRERNKIFYDHNSRKKILIIWLHALWNRNERIRGFNFF